MATASVLLVKKWLGYMLAEGRIDGIREANRAKLEKWEARGGMG